MKYAEELRKSLIEITSNPYVTRDVWEEAIKAKVRELTEKYREEHSRQSTNQRTSQKPTSSDYPED